MSHAPFEPKNPLIRWIEYRMPIMGLMYGTFVSYRAPKNLNYWWNFGSLAGICLVVQMITGIILAMHYAPNADLAFNSTEHIMRDVNYGWLLRYIHANGASMFFLVVYIHIFRGLYYGSYKNPRELLWLLGVVIFVLMIATAFTGYVLPWGQMSFWAATVITNLFSSIDQIVSGWGTGIAQFLWGGYAVGNPTLNRFFSLHYLLPFTILGVVILHMWSLHRFGSNNPLGIDIKDEKSETVAFHPYYTAKDTLGLIVFLILFAGIVFLLPNYLGHPDNYIPANPLVTPEHIVPEWYFLPFYAILRAIPYKLPGVIAMFASIGLLLFMPWLDLSKVRSATFRPVYKFFFWFLLVDCIVLGVVGANPPEGIWLLIGRLATAYYFLHFLFLVPMIGFFEKPKPLPDSISKPVLAAAE